MSTRCQIGIYEKADQGIEAMDILLYRHSDGYPGTVDGKEYGVLTDIIPLIKSFRQYRGDDAEYLGAQLLHDLMKKHDECMAKYRKAGGPPQYTGHGICGDKQFHPDIEYYYAVYPYEIQVYDVVGHGPKDWKKIKTVPIVSKKVRESIEARGQMMDVPVGGGRADILI